MKMLIASVCAGLALVLAGCAAWFPQQGVKQAGSIVDYLYPDAKEPPQLKPAVTYLRPPVRVGIAFVPGGGWGTGLPEAEQTKLLEQVRAAFRQYDFIGGIEVIPTQYLREKGGFQNLEQVARMFNVEVMALLSYDQVQFNDSNALSVLYWTIIGAYIIHGDQYDIQTMVDASVFDVHSRKLLFRAPGTSQVKGSASLAGFSERARTARQAGYDQAVENLIPRLQGELGNFKERIRNDANFRVENKPGYTGGGDVGWLGLLFAGVLAGIAVYWGRRRA
ncbi:MAG: rhombotarget lipoprotein [Thiobacillus sp. 65-69]|nr:rhombotarget lipoprotein [Thiobacillus sp.]ODU90188.1 MAG: rhombotarget lipoprotein [Thiobacillus sp. SCN 65-179]OJW38376.1 MAG: rhombotarget lipoprotein [Thiobacillus sp. 65-69]